MRIPGTSKTKRTLSRTEEEPPSGANRIVWISSTESAQEAVELEFPDEEQSVKDSLVSQLKEQRVADKNRNQANVDYEQQRYEQMIEADDTMSREALEGVVVVKIYPSDPRLEPIIPTFGLPIYQKKCGVNCWLTADYFLPADHL